MSNNVYIRRASDAKPFIGKTLYWDDVGSRYIFLRQGQLEGTFRQSLIIDGDYKLVKSLKCLRTFEMGGEWERNKKELNSI